MQVWIVVDSASGYVSDVYSSKKSAMARAIELVQNYGERYHIPKERCDYSIQELLNFDSIISDLVATTLLDDIEITVFKETVYD